jgi:hypothetical protein
MVYEIKKTAPTGGTVEGGNQQNASANLFVYSLAHIFYMSTTFLRLADTALDHRPHVHLNEVIHVTTGLSQLLPNVLKFAFRPFTQSLAPVQVGDQLPP